MTDKARPDSIVGTRVRPVDWEAKTSGTARYAADSPPPGTLIGRILRSPHPYADIVELDIADARHAPGVLAVITAADFPPGTLYLHTGGEYSDRPPLADGVVRFIGQEVVAVAAETAAQADAALRLVHVRYRRRRAPLTVAAARSRKAPRPHSRPSGEPNVASRDTGTFGDVAAGRAASAVSVGGTYRYPRVSHLCMEPNTTLAWWHPDDQRLELWTSTHAPSLVQHEVAHVLGLQPEQVTCRDVAVGGGFGLKGKVAEHEAIAAALSRAAGRPVLVALDRQEEFSTTKPRHAFDTTMRLHADHSGRMCLVEADICVDNGAYNHFGPSVMKVGIKTLGSIYRHDGAAWDARLVDTALQPGGQFRGYGSPQTTLALECLVDELAEKVGADPLQFRIDDAIPAPGVTLAGERFGTSRLVDCLESVRDAIGWETKKREPRPGRGVGVAVSMHGSGSYGRPDANRSDAAIELCDDGRIVVRFGSQDPGTGQRTVLAQIAAHELGVDMDRVSVIMGDSENTPFDMGSWSSRGTHMGGHATRKAARELAAMLVELAREVLGDDDVVLANGQAIAPSGSIELGSLVGLSPQAVDGRLMHESTYVDQNMELFGADNPTPNHAASYSFAAHAVEVEVDPTTGQVSIIDYVAAHDIGFAINPTGVEGQIIGGVVQALGATLGEELIYEQGRLVNPAYLHYAAPRAPDLPRIRTILLEGADPNGPYGAKSVGELPVIPPAPAVANAIYDAIGVRVRELPFTPDKILSTLGRNDRRYRLLRRPDRWQVATIRALYPLGLHALLDRVGTRFAKSVPPRQVQAIERPGTVDALVEGLDPEAAVLGGGTDLLLQRQQGLQAPVRLISTRDVQEMRSVRERADGSLEVGGAVTLDIIERDDRFPTIVRNAVMTIASTQIRATATVGGNLVQAKRCWFFRNGFNCYKRGGWTCPCYAVLGDHRFYHAAVGAHRCQATTPSDLATVLTALDATADIRGRNRRREVTIGDLYTGPGETLLDDDEVIATISIPAPGLRSRGSFQKLRLWEGDFAVLSAAVTCIDGAEPQARVVFGALAPTPWRAVRTERKLVEPGVDDDAVLAEFEAELTHAGHPLPGNEWKLTAAPGLLRRALEDIWTASHTQVNSQSAVVVGRTDRTADTR